MIPPSDLHAFFPDDVGRPRAFFAPGRVNFIGEHTDYNDGFVLPLALELGITVLAARCQEKKLHVVSRQGDTALEVEIDLAAPAGARTGGWVDYVEGIARSLRLAGYDIGGAELLVGSDLPPGAGLSSSAALEIALGFALLSLAELPIDPIRLALVARDAEHHWVGTRCGVMDQLASACARPGSALLIDCRSLELKDVPLFDDSASILVADTRVKHALASSAYNRRREECEASVAILQNVLPGIQALRDVSSADLKTHGNLLSEPLIRRARHVVTENERVVRTVGLLGKSAFEAVGELLVESHRSLQHDYEVSCRELDFLVDAAIIQKGVFGARMTGGGFGGSIVCLVQTNEVEDVKRALGAKFQCEFGRDPWFFVTKGGQGAGEIEQ